jgi:hypothetical protein
VCEVTRLHVFDHFISIRFLCHRLAMGKRKCVFNVNLQQKLFNKLINTINSELSCCEFYDVIKTNKPFLKKVMSSEKYKFNVSVNC